jgi:hypothetical protein
VSSKYRDLKLRTFASVPSNKDLKTPSTIKIMSSSPRKESSKTKRDEPKTEPRPKIYDPEEVVDTQELFFDLKMPESGLSDLNLLKIKYLERENKSQRVQIDQIYELQTLYQDRLQEIQQ